MDRENEIIEKCIREIQEGRSNLSPATLRKVEEKKAKRKQTEQRDLLYNSKKKW